jgi:hypothetical protein
MQQPLNTAQTAHELCHDANRTLSYTWRLLRAADMRLWRAVRRHNADSCELYLWLATEPAKRCHLPSSAVYVWLRALLHLRSSPDAASRAELFDFLPGGSAHYESNWRLADPCW